MGLLDGVLSKLFGNKSDKDIKAIRPLVSAILSEYAKLAGLSNDDLRAKCIDVRADIDKYVSAENNEIASIKEKLDNNEIALQEKENSFNRIDKLEEAIVEKTEKKLTEVLPTVFAIVKETARRFTENDSIEVTANEFDRELATKYSHVSVKGEKAKFNTSWSAGGVEVSWNMIHYDVQLIGGVILHEGKIAEMATGEGKTLVATLPVFLNALSRKGVHIVTVNDYLAKRDSEWMGPLYEFHGLKVDCIDKHEPNSESRREAYLADVTFGTNSEFGFDYLRDNMCTNPDELVQRKHNYTIVDEVDSVLIDDARTPLIISGPSANQDHQREMFNEFKPNVQRLFVAQKKLASELLAEAKKLVLSEDKKEKEKGNLLLFRAYKGLPKLKPLIKFLSEPGIKTMMLKTENYYMQENNKYMPVVTDELFFVLDEKNNSIELTDKGIDLLSSTVNENDFFILPDIGSEIVEIEKSELEDSEKAIQKDSLLSSYSQKSERVHTVTQLLKAYALFEKDTEYVLMDNKVMIVDEQTGRIMDGRRYSDGLHQAIEAKEGVKVEAATQTFATVTLQNYFRMYNKLSGMTGTAETEAKELWDIYKLDVVNIPTNRPIVRQDNNDLVYKTAREKYGAVILQVEEYTKKGRPVLVGTTSVEISELLAKMLKMKGIKHNVLNAKRHQQEADIVAQAGQSGGVTIATNMAGRGTDIKLTDAVKESGGLAIIGTERHESRRVDRQLRGRAGRQGDTGSSEFFVSLEDNLMRMFGSDRIAKVMDRMGLEDGEVIQHGMISKSIERAQKKVEENHYGVRKRLLEYDDVMNSQREVIYSRRRNALYGERISVDVLNMIYDVCDNLVTENHGFNDFETFKLEVLKDLSFELTFTAAEYEKAKAEELTEMLYSTALEVHERKAETIAKQAYPVIKDVYKHQSHKYENIVVPVSDGKNVYQIIVNLEKAYKTEGLELSNSYAKSIVLATIDNSWKEHLREMDDLRQSVQNASYEQKDPLLIYKLESFNLFKSMMNKINKEIVSILMRASIYSDAPEQVKEAKEQKRSDFSKYDTSRPDELATNRDEAKPQPRKVEQKVGRNDPCPCGSGKKFKKCHGIES